MTPIERTEAIKNLVSSGLPALISTAGLKAFDEIDNHSPSDVENTAFCVYIDLDDDETDRENFGVILQVQLYGQDKVQEYHSVIMPFLKEQLTADIVEYETRDSIKSDLWPIDQNGSSFIYYTVLFTSELDDCEN